MLTRLPPRERIGFEKVQVYERGDPAKCSEDSEPDVREGVADAHLRARSFRLARKKETARTYGLFEGRI